MGATTRSKSNSKSESGSRKRKMQLTIAPSSANENENHHLPPTSPSPQAWPKVAPKKEGPYKNFPGLLAGLDEAIWDSLAHVDPNLFNQTKEKTSPFRNGLRILGLDWVANNTSQIRTPMGYQFDEAKKFYRNNGWRPPMQPLPKVKKVDYEDREWAPRSMDGGLFIEGKNFMNEDGELAFVIIGNGSTGDECILPPPVADYIIASIRQTGMSIVRGAIDKATVEKLRFGKTNESNGHPDAVKMEEMGRRTLIKHTAGSGLAGEDIYTRKLSSGLQPIGSYYSGLQDSSYLNRLQNVIVSSLKDEESTVTNTNEKRKYILLQYSKGGENWAHRDGNDGEFFRFQALLMLSNSDEYDGGEFYVAKRCNESGRITRTCCPKLNAGDLIIFRADKDGEYDHGMKTVTRGERVAVGLLQPK